MLTPGSLAILQASFEPGERGRAIGTWSGLGGVATAIGPFLGGWLVDAASWRWIFLLNLPLGIAVLAVGRAHVPESRDPDATAPRPARRCARRARARRADARADRAVDLDGRRRRRAARRLRRRRDAHRRAAGADVDVPVADVQRHERRHLLPVRRVGRDVLPARPRPAGPARLHAAAGWCGDDARDAGDAPAVGARRGARRAHRPAHPDDRRPAARRRGDADADRDQPRRLLRHGGAARHRRVRSRPGAHRGPAHDDRPRARSRIATPASPRA